MELPETLYCVLLGLAAMVLRAVPTPVPLTTVRPTVNPQQGLKYLEKFGYLPSASEQTGGLQAQGNLNKAIRQFQRFAHINITGELDEPTLEMMERPRCGVKDIVGTANSARKRRYAIQEASLSLSPAADIVQPYDYVSHQGSRWRKHDLTYRISAYTQDLPAFEVESAVEKAFQVWARHTPLTFTRIYWGRPDLDVKFSVGEHGDGNPFDGSGGELAHAFFPQYGGDAHFDDGETWTVRTPGGDPLCINSTCTDLFIVAAHEFGHSLGLGHSDVRGSLMAPFYQGYTPAFTLPPDDVEGIQNLYGVADIDRPSPHPRPRPPSNDVDVPDYDARGTSDPTTCSGHLDAITRTKNGSTYAFQGEFFWRLNDIGPDPGYPMRINDIWGVAGPIDAALFWPSTGKTYLIKGERYWRFTNAVLDEGYPASMERFRGVPTHVDAAFEWGRNGKTYFIKGNQYWRYSKGWGVDDGYPQPLSVWTGLPDKIDAAFQWKNGKTYFFQGGRYWRFDDDNLRVAESDPQYPRSTAEWWLGCPIQQEPDWVGSQDGEAPGTDSTDQPDGAEDQRVNGLVGGSDASRASWRGSLTSLCVLLSLWFSRTIQNAH
ncbi:MMP14 [Branchiostoma lanceolatum]|uniref:MMP14 protein n=1 Tax=Branchiostoma lanceolatum TaxID=7740 RepID=A0A8K0A9I5_BRALA|nr:MMP14 [Branchiostoma lanceolatum]